LPIHVVSVFGTQTRTQFYAKAYYIRISVFNPNLEDIPKIVMTTMFSNENRVSTIEQPNFITGDVVVTSAMKARDYTDNSIRELSCDSSGNLKINVTIDDLSPTDDGVMTYGSNDGTTPLVIKTDATGKLDIVVSSAMKARDYTDNSVRELACDSSGNLKINVTIDDLL